MVGIGEKAWPFVPFPGELYLATYLIYYAVLRVLEEGVRRDLRERNNTNTPSFEGMK